MTILNYSGRGRGGRGGRFGGRGRGYGRGGRSSFHRASHPFPGRSAPRASAKWVRPKNNEAGLEGSKSKPASSQNNESYTRPSHNMKKQGYNKLVLSTKPRASEVDIAQKKPPPSSEPPSKLITSNGSTSETRQVNDVASKTSSNPPGASSPPDTNHQKPSHKVEKVSLPASSQGPVTKAGASGGDRANMARLGRHKLVLVPEKKRNTSQNMKSGHYSDHASRGSQNQTEQAEGGPAQANMPMKRLGKHKLVLNEAKDCHGGKSASSTTNNGKDSKVNSKYSSADNPERQWSFPSQSSYHRKTGGRGQFRRQHQFACHNPAKRIKVTIQPSGSSDGDEAAAEEANPENTGGATDKLTDFAYRSTKRQGRYHAQRNMGLVRVQPDVKKTPICPTFLRGVQCTDKYCRKRHDVPKEFATPICSFFQRRGQCLKGDECVFRHVKVNPRAMVCPNFSLLGFCDDETCTMKHVREKLAGRKP